MSVCRMVEGREKEVKKDNEQVKQRDLVESTMKVGRKKRKERKEKKEKKTERKRKNSTKINKLIKETKKNEREGINERSKAEEFG